MKMEKITQLLEMASNKIANCQPNTTTQTSISSSNQSSSLNMSKTVNNSTSDINSTFNLIAGNFYFIFYVKFSYVLIVLWFSLFFIVTWCFMLGY
jgi:hypothetical protein